MAGNKSVLILVMIVFSVDLSSCGTIRYGVSQQVGIASSPLGASVTVDDKPYGETPVLLHLRRNRNHRVRVELPGHPPYETEIQSRLRISDALGYASLLAASIPCYPPYSMGDALCLIVFIPVWTVSLGVDAVAGGLYDLTPDQIVVPLEEKQ